MVLAVNSHLRTIFEADLLNMMKKILSFTFFYLIHFNASSQVTGFQGNLQTIASLTSKDQIPFWIRSNQFGSIPLSGPSLSFVGSFNRGYDTSQIRLVDWGMGIEGRTNVGKNAEFILVEGYAKGKLGVFELKGGRMKETLGLTDTLLTTGNFAISGNALGIPKIQLAIPEFYALPVFGKILAFKGQYAQGWLGNKAIQEKRVESATTYFHQKSFYVRLGKPAWKLKLYGGFNDQVFYGHEAQIFESFNLNNWQKYQSVVLGRNWAFSKVGNHAGNIDLRIEYHFNQLSLAVYRQNFYEVGALYHLANIADGINGVSIVNAKPKDGHKFRWKRVVLEFMYSKNQAGEAWSKKTKTGNENYLNHYLYKDGWSYRGLGLGTPFITQASIVRPGQSSDSTNFFINNRVAVIQFGSTAEFKRFNFLIKLSYSSNYGTHETKTSFKRVDQLSTYVELVRELDRKWQVGLTIASDTGRLLYNSFGCSFKVCRNFH